MVFCNHLVLLAFSLWPGFGPHKYHASLTEMDFNHETGKLEILLRLFSDDLQLAVNGTKVGGGPLGEGSQGEQKVFAYLKTRFAVGSSAGPELANLEWVGMEFEVDICWVYLEASVRPGTSLLARNSLFFELYDDQVNTVTLKGKGGSKAAIFKSGEGQKEIPWMDSGSVP